MILLETPSIFAPPLVLPPVGSPQPTTIPLPLSGAILHVPGSSPDAATTALRALRTCPAARRRIVWCNATDLVRSANQYASEWGDKIVTLGEAQMVVLCGSAARDVAVAVRDAGLPLGRVVVCRDDATARNVLGDSFGEGDVVLALGVSADSCQRLVERLEFKFQQRKGK